ncbi:MAG: pyridoxamine 5'-phosphate oxidase family protein, partial [Brevibacterium yomogidense]
MTVAWELQGSFVDPQVWASGLKKDGAVVGTSEAVEILSVDTCWELLRTTTVARLAVQTANGPDIFPINIAVDGGTLVFRSAEGTKVTGALNGPVAVEADGRDPDTDHAWSVVVKGHTQRIHKS